MITVITDINSRQLTISHEQVRNTVHINMFVMIMKCDQTHERQFAYYTNSHIVYLKILGDLNSSEWANRHTVGRLYFEGYKFRE